MVAVPQPLGVVAGHDELHRGEERLDELLLLVVEVLADALGDGDRRALQFQHAEGDAVDVEHDVGTLRRRRWGRRRTVTSSAMAKSLFSGFFQWPVVSSQIKEACSNDLRRSQRCHDRRNTGRHKDPDPMVSEHIDLRLKSLLALARSVMVRGLNLLLLRHCSRPRLNNAMIPRRAIQSEILTIRSATAAVE